MLNRLIERATTTGAALTIACAGTLLMPASPAFAQSEPGRQGGSVEVASGPTLAESFWQTARFGGEDEMLGLLQSVREAGTPQRGFGASVDLALESFAKREAQRDESIAEADAEFAAKLAEYEADGSPIALSEALAQAVQFQLLYRDDSKLFTDERVVGLIERAEAAARAAESRGDWLIANELFYRLDVLLSDSRRFHSDLKRLEARLAMVRLYNPQRLWELRNDRRILAGESALPAYNPYGDGFREKLDGISRAMVYRSIARAATEHVDGGDGGDRFTATRRMLLDGLDAVSTMATTTDLTAVFPGMSDEAARERFLAGVRGLQARVRDNSDEPGPLDVRRITTALLDLNATSVGVMEEAVLHEFGIGAMAALDDYTGVIWPDEMPDLRRSTQGDFVGVGIQIQLDELMNVTVVTPLEGSPAQRAGVRAGDVIKAVDGISAVGFTLDQAVEVITGPPGTGVVLTMERELDSGDKTEVDFTLQRQRIDLPTVKGWEKTGPGDFDWDYFLDDEHRIGYVRLTGFTDDTTRDFDRAIRDMRQRGLKGLVLDLRYNPGGLLDQAVSISERFVDRGLIVRTEDALGRVGEEHYARPIDRSKSVRDLPIVVLINEGSASASEIVSGAIQAGARRGRLQAMVVGQRTFGKGSVQNLFLLPGGNAAMKLTTQYYRIDSPRLIHRRAGSTEWGIDPDLAIEMLPKQQEDWILLRRDADVLPIDEFGNVIADAERPDPDTLLTDGVDLQTQAAVLLLKAQVAGTSTAGRDTP